MRYSPAVSVFAYSIFAVFLFVMPQVLAVRTFAAEEIPPQILIQGEFRDGIDVFAPQAAVSLDVNIVDFPAGTVLPQGTKPAILKVVVQQSAKQNSSKPESEPEKSSNFSLPVNIPSITAGRKTANPVSPSFFEYEISVVLSEKMPLVPIAFHLPETEGVYDVILTLHHKTENHTLTNSFRQLHRPLKRSDNGILAQSTFQCVVFDSRKSGSTPKKIQELAAADLTDTFMVDTIAGKDGLPPSRRWALVPTLPKVGNLSGILTPEMLRRSGTSNEKQPAKELDLPLGELSRSVSHFLEQYAEKPDSHYFSGGGHTGEITVVFSDADGKPSSKSMTLTKIGPVDSDGTEAWKAFPLHIKETDVPHLLEIEYPAQTPSSLGVCVFELPNAADGITVPPVLLNYNFCLNDEVIPRFKISADNPVLSHKVIFYPKTKHPVLLLSNRSKKDLACFGRISVSRITEEPDTTLSNHQSRVIPLPGASLPESQDNKSDGDKFERKVPRRLFAAYLHQLDLSKFFMRNVPAVHSNYPNETFFPADWNAFYNGTLQLTDLLKRNGYNGIMFNACSRHAVLYRSVILHYGSKEHVGGAQTSTKDALKLAAQMFERERITFIPSVDFNMLLPSIENKIHYEPELAKQLLAPDSTAAKTKVGMNGERYNLLHPLVQEAMLNVLSELATRCAEYKSFAGVAVILSPDGYAALSNPKDGLDTETLRRFQEDSGITLPKELLSSVDVPAAVQYYFQATPQVHESWQRWRCKQVADFYSRAADVLVAVRPDARLYFANGTILDRHENGILLERQEIGQYCLPSLFVGNPLPQIFQLLGFDLVRNALPPTVSMMQPERVASSDISDNAFMYQLFDSPDFTKFRKQNTAQQSDFESPVLFFHETENDRNVVLSAEQARKRFVRHLAQSDIPMLFSGGSSIVPLSDSTTAEFAEAFQQLPMIPFLTFSKPDAPEETIQPIVIRYANAPDGYYVYLLNNAPFPVKANLLLRCSEPAFQELSGKRSLPAMEASGGKYLWKVELSPYDFAAVRFNGNDAAIENAAAECPEDICGPNGTLRRTINLLGECIKKAQQGRVWNKLENPNCEPLDNNSNAIVGWELSAPGSAALLLDTVNKVSGLSSIQFSKGDAAEPAALYSNVFPAPQTGRLFVSLNLGMAGTAAPLQVVLSGKSSGKQFVQTFPLNTAALFPKSEAGRVQWQPLTIPFYRLPMNGIEDLRVGFVLAQSGTIWIDNVVLYDLSFS
ncbi:MAG: hypothetical protein FWE67_13195, partial [Planctomycetaceae bacterium]|nr:hypothetical protein [Planctomycetaceae bacterium]